MNAWASPRFQQKDIALTTSPFGIVLSTINLLRRSVEFTEPRFDYHPQPARISETPEAGMSTLNGIKPSAVPGPYLLKIKVFTYTQKVCYLPIPPPIFKSANRHTNTIIPRWICYSHTTRVQKPKLESMPRGTSDTLVQPRSKLIFYKVTYQML
ncbi:hypothetical protein M0804_010181 [Polistes exclamans]|nr:hypothetical protein M0804_010181 [Polistes exclamans]